ncbi:MAG: FAD-dependent oxidoreductase [Smithellaceae bacterium]
MFKKKMLFWLLLISLLWVVSTPAIAETLSTDVVVVGGGASGLAAAVVAADGGAKVILLEKMPVVGGTTNFAEGVFAVGSRLQREKNLNYTTDWAFKYMMEYTHWRANARLARAFIDKSADTIEWLEKQGVKFKEPAANYPGGYMTWHIIDGRGKAMAQALHERAREKGVTVLFKATGKELIKDSKGRISGIKAVEDGKEIKINTKVGVIATGGYINNKEMLAKYTAFGPDIIPVGSAGKIGEGIQMAWAAGADSFGTDVLQLYRPGIPGEGPESHLNAPARQPYLWVNQLGERFCDESIIFSWPYAGNALANQPGRVMYVIFDENTKKFMMEKGIDVGVGVMVPVATKLTRLDSDLQRGIEKGFVFVASSIKELAGKMKVDAQRLEATIDEYNKMADQRQDTLFVKDPKYIQPVRTAKFYAMKAVPFALGTLGGIKINHKTEVLAKSQEAIPGLYAVGNDAGGLYGDSYDVVLAGSTLGFAVNSGRIAGENALEYIK